jgi:FKBP12-rapamycin complex-associated protein
VPAFVCIRSRQKEETTKLLCLLIQASPGLIVNYTDELLDVLLRTAYDSETTPIVAQHVLRCLGELAQVAGESIGPRVTKILALVIETLQATSPTILRSAALKTLGQVASYTGTIVDPYVDYPELLLILNRFVNMETELAVRREVIKVLGILGALDPYRRKVSVISSLCRGQDLRSRYPPCPSISGSLREG